MFLISKQDAEAIGSYLMSRPYHEVENFIPILRNMNAVSVEKKPVDKKEK